MLESVKIVVTRIVAAEVEVVDAVLLDAVLAPDVQNQGPDLHLLHLEMRKKLAEAEVEAKV